MLSLPKPRAGPAKLSFGIDGEAVVPGTRDEASAACWSIAPITDAQNRRTARRRCWLEAGEQLVDTTRTYVEIADRLPQDIQFALGKVNPLSFVALIDTTLAGMWNGLLLCE
jgi:hypothetical protein